MNEETVLSKPSFPRDLEIIRTLFLEYQEEIQADLCFQSFQEELDQLPGKYAEPKGCIILAYWKGEPAGIVALRPMSTQGICEMKRLYVRDQFKGKGIGRKLVERIVEEAEKGDYKKMRLDTLGRLKAAVNLYRNMDFQETPPYYSNPLKGVVYMEKVL